MDLPEDYFAGWSPDRSLPSASCSDFVRSPGASDPASVFRVTAAGILFQLPQSWNARFFLGIEQFPGNRTEIDGSIQRNHFRSGQNSQTDVLPETAAFPSDATSLALGATNANGWPTSKPASNVRTRSAWQAVLAYITLRSRKVSIDCSVDRRERCHEKSESHSQADRC